MSWLTTTATELYGLFVDDVPFAAAIVAWLLAIVAIVRFLPGILPGVSLWAGPLLAVGLILLLVESATRSARRHRARK